MCTAAVTAVLVEERQRGSYRSLFDFELAIVDPFPACSFCDDTGYIYGKPCMHCKKGCLLWNTVSLSSR